MPKPKWAPHNGSWGPVKPEFLQKVREASKNGNLAHTSSIACRIAVSTLAADTSSTALVRCIKHCRNVSIQQRCDGGGAGIVDEHVDA
jgi:hypothetical protein